MTKRFIGGASTQPEIDALNAAFTPTPGASVSHDDVARIAGIEVGTYRFVTVTNRWRKMIERNTALRSESRDRVFYFLTAQEALDRSRGDLYRNGKAIGRMHVRAGSVNTANLTAEGKEAQRIIVRETAALLDSVRKSAKAIQPPAPTRAANLRLAKA